MVELVELNYQKRKNQELFKSLEEPTGLFLLKSKIISQFINDFSH